MEEYEKKVTGRKGHKEKEPWEIFVSQGCKMRNVIPYCHKMFNSNQKIVLSGTGAQINKTISIAEIVKRKHKSVVQETDLSYSEFEDRWEPKDMAKGLDSLSVTRHVPTITITLSLANGEDKTNPRDDDTINKETLAQLKRELKADLREMINEKSDSFEKEESIENRK